MKISIHFHLFFLLIFTVSCRTINVKTVAKLPTKLLESSGLIVESPNRFWSLNDGGNEPNIYQFDSTGKLLKTVKIEAATNVDWEEMALDTEGALYIGDFGNNNQNRRNLLIYKILNFKSKYQSNVIKPDSLIEFSYEDQLDFPPKDAQKRFDAEAMIVEKDAIFILTKDFYSKPYAGITGIYQIPNQAGKHVAKLVKILPTNNGSKFKGAITAAAQNGDGTVVLMSYLRLFIFSNFNGKHFWEGEMQTLKFSLTNFAQRESIAFDPTNNCRLFITSEKAKIIGGGKLSVVNFCKNKILRKKGSVSK